MLQQHNGVANRRPFRSSELSRLLYYIRTNQQNYMYATIITL
jgi:hypothetical protein